MVFNHTIMIMKNMKLIRLFLFSFLLALSSGAAMAQAQGELLTGRVIDSREKQPIIGATVVLKDSENRTIVGTTTDVEGNYSLRGNLKGLRLMVTSTGYKTSPAITIGQRRTIHVQLESTSNLVEEVVVSASKPVDDGTGMGLSKVRSTAAISSINMAELEDLQSASIDQALQGRLAG